MSGPGPSAVLSKLLGVFGLSCGQFVLLALGAIALHCLCLFWATRLAGLRASLLRAFGTLLLTLGLMIPLGFVFLFVAAGLGRTGQAVVSQLAVAGAESLAIKLLYHTAFPRALFAYLAASLLTMAGLVPLLILIF